VEPNKEDLAEGGKKSGFSKGPASEELVMPTVGIPSDLRSWTLL